MIIAAAKKRAEEAAAEKKNEEDAAALRKAAEDAVAKERAAESPKMNILLPLRTEFLQVSFLISKGFILKRVQRP